ncbi:MAG: hypothetical protein GX640_23190 [Fibrobacter sp.]|nr:hypothetical protein [Fibrobacter sp.]
MNYNQNEILQEVFQKTDIVRKPISGIISGYHELPYILVAPNDENPSHTIEINGKINVSPKFIISPYALKETFGDVFDPETFDHTIEGRLFSFGVAKNKNVKIENEYFRVTNYEAKPEEHLNKVLDTLLAQENTRTGLIFGPKFQFYPVSIDRYLTELLDREFRV